MTSSTLTLTPDDALSVLEYWHTSAERLMFVHRRAEDCVTRIGCGRVRNATAREAWMDTNHGGLRIMMHSAAFEFGALAHGAAEGAHDIQADGLLICVDRDDWIFLRSSPASDVNDSRHNRVKGTLRRTLTVEPGAKVRRNRGSI